MREIEQLTAAHELELRDAWSALAERHNQYPAESRLPMDPRTGEYALVNGCDYRLAQLDAAWILERFPADLGKAVSVDSVSSRTSSTLA